ncbi:DNA polymerase IV [Gilvimarinus sp. 2_MG-2023]|uniref:DNA polymerase IV n=1 Tax=Gilvimarinus sp. 2_MG-2023 TaxID=3062666 RepID=UPI0026E27581|nr:DNA polymerase IV [Gilvimarinus sp. 2_MG-2023]MDO6570282.1 DNA polymerase IV [Gilvimarinus sp. 2_MG-2023]
MNRFIIHIDADCFFAAIEMRDRPELFDRPMAIGGSANRRGVISTCNYSARQFGVRSAMATAYALRLCPGLTLLEHRMALYREVSQEMMAIFHKYSDIVEPLSLDEAFLDVSSNCESLQEAGSLAQEIRQKVWQTLGITVSAGVAGNKFLAKVASDWRKPDGMFVIDSDRQNSFVAQLPIRCIPGVGKVTSDQLQFMGVSLCQDLYCHSENDLVKRFGRFGARLYHLSRGVDERPVKPTRERKSVSVEQTYAQDIESLNACEALLPELYQRLMLRLEKLPADTVIAKGFVKIKFSDFRQTTLERLGGDWAADAFLPLLAQAYSRGNGRVRLLGLGVRLAGSGPQSAAVEQINLL